MADLTPVQLRILRTISLARQVNHYYWALTDGDEDVNGRVSIENLQHIIERMIQLPIYKRIVPFEGVIVRGIFERYPDHIKIFVRAGMHPNETRYIAVKEMCHGLADAETEYCTKGVETIHELLKYRGLGFDGGETEALRSERLAELLAFFLIYSMDFRDVDYKAIYEDKTATVASIAAKRGVPAYLVASVLDKDYLATCNEAWSLVAEKVPFDPLKPLPERKK